MNPQSELGMYMKAARSKSVEAAGRHWSQEEMIAFYQGQMPEAECEASRAHLAYCPECLQLWRDVRDFCAPAEAGEAEASEFDVRREWKELWGRIQTDPQTATRTEIAHRPSRFAWRAALPLAASIALALGTGTVALFWQQERQQRIEAQQAAAQLQVNQQEMQARVAHLEQTGKTQSQFDEQLKLEREKNQELKARLDQLSLSQATQPQTNNRIYELQLPGSSMRGSNQGNKPSAEIPISASAKSWILRVAPDKPEEFSSYVIKILDSRNATKWDSGSLKLDQSQNLVATFPGSFLNKGRYQLLIYGQNGSGLKLLGKYEVRYGER